jgi:16S rRNA (guanine1516-N2)-methyltransferase
MTGFSDITLNYITSTSRSPDQDSKAHHLSDELGLPLKSSSDPCPTFPHYRLCLTDERLEVQTELDSKRSRLFVEFVKGSLGYRRRRGGGIQQTLAKAVGIKSRNDQKTVLDATAGLGVDAFALAMLGCWVELVERSPIMVALLKDGLERARRVPELKSTALERIKLTSNDSLEVLAALAAKKNTLDAPDVVYPDVVYLDPMYPESAKSALNKIELRIIRAIVGEDLDAETLLKIALGVAKHRVVVKRPPHAAPLAHLRPSMIVASKKNRYDIYLTRENRVKETR